LLNTADFTFIKWGEIGIIARPGGISGLHYILLSLSFKNGYVSSIVYSK